MQLAMLSRARLRNYALTLAVPDLYGVRVGSLQDIQLLVKIATEFTDFCLDFRAITSCNRSIAVVVPNVRVVTVMVEEVVHDRTILFLLPIYNGGFSVIFF